MEIVDGTDLRKYFEDGVIAFQKALLLKLGHNKHPRLLFGKPERTITVTVHPLIFQNFLARKFRYSEKKSLFQQFEVRTLDRLTRVSLSVFIFSHVTVD